MTPISILSFFSDFTLNYKTCMYPKISALIFTYYAQYSTYAGPSCHWLDWESLGTSHGVSQSCSEVSWCSSPANHMPLSKGNLYYAITWKAFCTEIVVIGNQNILFSAVNCKGRVIHILNLLRVYWIAGQLSQMHKFEVKSPKLSQDTAPGWGPTPAPTGATATWMTFKHVH